MGIGIKVTKTMTVSGASGVMGIGGGEGIDAGTLIVTDGAMVIGQGGETTSPDVKYDNTARSIGISAKELKVSNGSQVQGEGGTVNATVNNGDTADSIGVYVGSFEVDNAYLKGTGGVATHLGYSARSIGIFCYKTDECKIINDAGVEAAGGTATAGGGKYACSDGISASKLTVDGSTLKARAGTGDSASDVHSSGTFTLKNGATLERTFNRNEDLSKVLVEANNLYVGDSAKAYDCTVKLMAGSKITGTLAISGSDGKTLAELLPDDCAISGKTLGATTLNNVTISSGHTCTYDDDEKCTCGRMRPVYYKDENGKTQTVTSYTLVKSGDNFTPATGWYVVKDNATIGSTICPQENADVKLILCDGIALSASQGINGATASLTVYGTAAGTGALNTQAFSENGAECDICLNSLKTAGGKINADKASRVIIKGDMTVSGGSVTLGKSEISGSLAAASGAALAAVLANDYAYYSGNKWYTAEKLNGINTLGNVRVRQIPLKSATLTTNKESYTYGDDVVLTMNVTTTNATVNPATVQYEYYKKDSGNYELQHREDDYTEYKLGKLAAGTYTYKCVVEYDGYTIADTAEFTVNNAAFDKVEIKQKGTLTYTGADQQIEVEADIKTKNNQEPTVTYSEAQNGTYGAELPSFKNAGDYTVYYKIAAENHESTAGSFAVKISPAPLTPSIKAQDKQYDGTTDAAVTVSFAGLVNGETLEKGTDYNVQAGFIGPEANKSKQVSAYIGLGNTAKAKNYTLTTNTVTDTTAKITQAPLKISAAAVDDKFYDGTARAAVTSVSFTGLKGGNELVRDTDYEVTAAFVNEDAAKNKTVTVTVTLKDTTLASNYELESNTCTSTAEIKPLSTNDEEISIAAFSPMTYTGTPQTPAAEVKIGDLTVTGSWSAVTNIYDKTTFTANGNFTGTIDNKDTGMARARLVPNPEKTTTAKILRGSALSAAEVAYGEFSGVDGNAVTGDFAWKDSIDSVTETTTARMTFTEGSGNYEVEEFDVTVSVYTLGGGSGGSGTKKNNLDGSTTITKTDKRTGTVTETTTRKDGSSTTTITEKDGTITVVEKDKSGNTATTVKRTDGTETTVEKNNNGTQKTTEKAADGTVCVTETTADGATVKTVTDKNGSITAEITTDGDKECEITIPAENADTVTKIIITDENGNTTEITDFEATDDGIKLNFAGSGTAVPVREERGGKKEFADVHGVNHWATQSVDYVYAKGLMAGVAQNYFAPDDVLTRAMLVTVLYRAEGSPKAEKDIPFADVTKDMYCADAVIWARENGIVNGVSENAFAPDECITREQIAAIIYRYAAYKGTAPTGAWAIRLDYDDAAQIADYATEGVMYCTLKGIMHGKDAARFAPKDAATRAEIAAILQRFIENAQ